MPEIEITDDQRARLEEVREALAEEVVGPYGTVEPADAVEYLLDLFEDQQGLPLPEGFARGGGETPGDDAAGDDEGTAGDVEAEAEEVVAAMEAGQEVGDRDHDDADQEGDAPDGNAESDGDQLNAMLNLLEEHAGKWREDPSGDERYEVDLPEGGTETARTKDDVKAILFRNYR